MLLTFHVPNSSLSKIRSSLKFESPCVHTYIVGHNSMSEKPQTTITLFNCSCYAVGVYRTLWSKSSSRSTLSYRSLEVIHSTTIWEGAFSGKFTATTSRFYIQTAITFQSAPNSDANSITPSFEGQASIKQTNRPCAAERRWFTASSSVLPVHLRSDNEIHGLFFYLHKMRLFIFIS